MEEPFTIITTTIMIMETVLVMKLNRLTFVAADKEMTPEWSVDDRYSGNQNDGK